MAKLSNHYGNAGVFLSENGVLVNVVMIFMGGADDRKALKCASMMARYPSVCLNVVRIIMADDENDSKIERQELHVKEVNNASIAWFYENYVKSSCRNSSSSRVGYVEMKLKNGVDVLNMMRILYTHLFSSFVINTEIIYCVILIQYVNARGNQILTGVNFASAAAGIREETWRQLGGRISFRGQVRNNIPAVQHIMVGIVKLALKAGKATPAPFVGLALGSKGVNIMGFCKEYNSKTADKAGYVIPVEITVYDDKSFTFILKTPPPSVLLLKVADTLQLWVRKVAIIGVGQVRCSPSELAQSSSVSFTNLLV